MLSWVSGDTGNGFPSRSFGVSIPLASDSESTMTRRDLSGRVWKVTLPPLDAFLELESVF